MIQVPAILTSFSSKSDGGASVRFSTNELSDEDFLILKKHQGLFGYMMFKENTFQTTDLPKEQAEEGAKTPSKRLRAVLFLLWKQKGEPLNDFEIWYRKETEKIITYLKTKLDD